MKKSDFIELQVETFDKALDLIQSKGNEYTEGDDQLYNAKAIAKMFSLIGLDSVANTPSGIFMIYFLKQMFSFAKYIKQLERNDTVITTESLQSRVVDMINYIVLIYARLLELQNER